LQEEGGYIDFITGEINTKTGREGEGGWLGKNIKRKKNGVTKGKNQTARLEKKAQRGIILFENLKENSKGVGGGEDWVQGTGNFFFDERKRKGNHFYWWTLKKGEKYTK